MKWPLSSSKQSSLNVVCSHWMWWTPILFEIFLFIEGSMGSIIVWIPIKTLMLIFCAIFLKFPKYPWRRCFIVVFELMKETKYVNLMDKFLTEKSPINNIKLFPKKFCCVSTKWLSVKLFAGHSSQNKTHFSMSNPS